MTLQLDFSEFWVSNPASMFLKYTCIRIQKITDFRIKMHTMYFESICCFGIICIWSWSTWWDKTFSTKFIITEEKKRLLQIYHKFGTERNIVLALSQNKVEMVVSVKWQQIIYYIIYTVSIYIIYCKIYRLASSNWKTTVTFMNKTIKFQNLSVLELWK